MVPQAIDHPSKHFASRWGHKALYIIVHSTASPTGDPWNTLSYLASNNRGVSIHELVLPGYVYRMVTDERAAQHCYSESAKFPAGEFSAVANCITWGIEGYQEATKSLDVNVVNLMAQRVALACQRFGLGMVDVLGHCEIDPDRRSDPVGVNMEDFRHRVQRVLWDLRNVPLHVR